MKILFLSRWFPCPPNNGARIRVFNFLHGLSGEHEVTLISFGDPVHDSGLNGLTPERWEVVPWRDFSPRSRKGILGLLSRAPRSLVDTYSRKMERAIRSRLQSESYDLIVASGLTMASYSHLFSDVPAILEELEVGVYYQKFNDSRGRVERLRHYLTWFKLGVYLREVLPRFRLCTMVSENERRLLANLAPGYESVVVIPNGVDLNDYRPMNASPQPKSLIFCGSCDYGPNYQGISWFLEKAFPLIRSQDSDVYLTITGTERELPFGPSSGVFQTGYVDDVKPLISSACVSIAPILTGGGTRLKILESMALGTPVVSTSKGAEGLDVTSGRNVMIGDSPASFADSVSELLRNDSLRNSITAEALELVRERYNWPQIMSKFLSLLEEDRPVAAA